MGHQEALSYVLLLLIISILADAFSVTARKLQRQHTLFGKPTQLLLCLPDA